MNKEDGMMQWNGYLRKNGAKGIRNRLLVIYTVECASFVAKEAVRRAKDSEAEVIGFSGCTDNEYAVHLLISLIRHPNVGGVLAVGLGCEYIQAKRLAQAAAEEGKASDYLLIQEAGGTLPAIAESLRRIQRIKEKMSHTERVPMTCGDLIIGAECGGSDYTSGLAGNVVVGRLFDELIDRGGTAVFEEIVEAVGLRKQLAERGADAAAKLAIGETYDKALRYCQKVRQYSISPGNFAGGLTTIEEKSMGALIKSGSRPIQGVLKVGDRPKRRGLWLLDSTPDPYWMQFGITNPNDNEGLTDLIASGCQLVFLVTGRGNVVGNAVAPVIKITGNEQTFRRMEGDMDFNAGRVLSGQATMGELTRELFALVCRVSAGEKTKAELLGHCEYCIPYKYQNRRNGSCRL